MDRPLVSVITVTYNSALYVRDAIESVLHQSYTNIEYIIGDDCSTDSSWNIIQEFKDRRIKAYRNDRNLGEYPNRSKAIGLASGKYCMFIDGDDIIYSHGVSFFVEMMEEFPAAAYAVQKNYYNNIVYPVLLSSRDVIVNYFFGKISFLTSSFASNFFRTDILRKEGGLSTDFKIGDDEIRLRLACKYPVLLVAGWVTWPRETPQQASSKLQNWTGLSELFHVVRTLKEKGLFQRLGAGLNEAIMGRMDSRVVREIKRCLRTGRFKSARSLMKATGTTGRRLLRKEPAGTCPEDFLADSTPSRPYKQPIVFTPEE